MIEYIHNCYVNNEPLILDKEYTILTLWIVGNEGTIKLKDKYGNIQRLLIEEFLEKYKEYFRIIKLEKIKNNLNDQKRLR